MIPHKSMDLSKTSTKDISGLEWMDINKESTRVEGGHCRSSSNFAEEHMSPVLAVNLNLHPTIPALKRGQTVWLIPCLTMP
mmetsp:Transcript_2580/g.7166  ORF Transcript_2580/g.7166 Transcript_2580/m.7166 type:complete len:81 (-) Transcript_2580:1690-1932(-)